MFDFKIGDEVRIINQDPIDFPDRLLFSKGIVIDVLENEETILISNSNDENIIVRKTQIEKVLRGIEANEGESIIADL